MKQVLISAHIDNIVDFEFLRNLIDFLRRENYTYKVYDNLNTSPIVNEDKINYEQFDLLLVVNQLMWDYQNDINICVIYFSNSSNIKNVEGIFQMDYDFCFQYGGKKNFVIDSSSEYLNILYDEHNDQNDVYTYDTLIIIQYSETFYSLLRFFNTLYDKRVAVFCEDVDDLLFNEHVTLIDKNDFELVLKSSKNVIGEGPLLLKAILMEKPVLVAGKFGLGGIVNSKNVYGLLETSFSGRIGGTENELIPLNLLRYEYSLLDDLDKSTLVDIKKSGASVINSNKIFLKNVLENFHKNVCYKNILDSVLIKNNKFGYFSISNPLSHIAYNRYTRQYLYRLTEQEYNFIAYFINHKTSREVINIHNYQINDIENMIKKMIRLKILKYVL